MSFEQRENSGALFKNANKKADKHPDYTGSARIEGSDYDLAAWIRTSKKGDKFMSLSMKPKEAKPARNAEERQAEADNEINDEIPF